MSSSDKTVYVGNIAREVDQAYMYQLFQHCGTVIQVRIAGDPTYETRYAFVEFMAPNEANTAMLLDGMEVFGRAIRVSMARGGAGPGIIRSNDPDRVTRTVHIGGFPIDDVTEESLADYFSHIGEVTAVRKSGRFAWVEFATLKASQAALALDGESMGTGTLRVQQSKTPIMSAGWRAPQTKHSKSSAPSSTGPAPQASPAGYAPQSQTTTYYPQAPQVPPPRPPPGPPPVYAPIVGPVPGPAPPGPAPGSYPPRPYAEPYYPGAGTSWNVPPGSAPPPGPYPPAAHPLGPPGPGMMGPRPPSGPPPQQMY